MIAASISLAPIKVLTLKDICEPTLSRLYADDDVQKRYSTSFFTALSDMTSLESSSLSFSKFSSDGDDPEPLSLIVEALKPLHLSSIKLQHVSGSPGSFVTLLAQHESTLRRISFEDVGIVDRDPLWTWERPVHQMRSMAQLQQIHLAYLCETSNERTISRLEDSHGHTSWSFEGEKDSIAQGIARLIDEVEFDSNNPECRCRDKLSEEHHLCIRRSNNSKHLILERREFCRERRSALSESYCGISLQFLERGTFRLCSHSPKITRLGHTAQAELRRSFIEAVCAVGTCVLPIHMFAILSSALCGIDEKAARTIKGDICTNRYGVR